MIDFSEIMILWDGNDWMGTNFKYFMTMNRCFIVTIQLTVAFEGMWIYYIMNVVKLLHVSVTLCDHLQGDVLRRIYYEEIKTHVRI
jgi:hypothetical protein